MNVRTAKDPLRVRRPAIALQMGDDEQLGSVSPVQRRRNQVEILKYMIRVSSSGLDSALNLDLMSRRVARSSSSVVVGGDMR